MLVARNRCKEGVFPDGFVWCICTEAVQEAVQCTTLQRRQQRAVHAVLQNNLRREQRASMDMNCLAVSK